MRKLVVLATAAAVALGCKEPAAPTPAGPAGQYPLRTIDGNPPPQIISSSAEGTVSILSGLVVLRADNTFTDSTALEIVTSSSVERVSDVGRGTWRLSGDTVFFRVATSEYFMLRNGAELVQDFDGIELVYRR